MPKKNNAGKYSTQLAALPAWLRVELLNNHCAISGPFQVGQDVWCMHCGKRFKAESCACDERMSREAGEIFFECPNDCSGSPLDFAELPWWDTKRTKPSRSGWGHVWRRGHKPVA
jgi:hypothetical protein